MDWNAHVDMPRTSDRSRNVSPALLIMTSIRAFCSAVCPRSRSRCGTSEESCRAAISRTIPATSLLHLTATTSFRWVNFHMNCSRHQAAGRWLGRPDLGWWQSKDQHSRQSLSSPTPIAGLLPNRHESLFCQPVLNARYLNPFPLKPQSQQGVASSRDGANN